MIKICCTFFGVFFFWIQARPQGTAAHPPTPPKGYADIKALVYENGMNNLRFPLIILKDTGLSKEINSCLQYSLVGVKTVRTTGKGLFANHKWTPARGGMDELDYTVLVNTDKILSIEFDGEFMAAHGTPFEEYYQFDLSSGEPITLDQISVRPETI